MNKGTGYNTIKYFQHIDAIVQNMKTEHKSKSVLSDDDRFDISYIGHSLTKALIQDFDNYGKPNQHLITMAKIILASAEK